MIPDRSPARRRNGTGGCMPYPGSDYCQIRASGPRLDPERRSADHREHRREPGAHSRYRQDDWALSAHSLQPPFASPAPPLEESPQMICKFVSHVTTWMPATRPENTTSYRSRIAPASPSTALIAGIPASRLFLVSDARCSTHTLLPLPRLNLHGIRKVDLTRDVVQLPYCAMTCR